MAQWWAAQPQQHWLSAVLSARLAACAGAAAEAPSQCPSVSLLPSTVTPHPALQAQDESSLQEMSGILASLSPTSTVQQVCTSLQLLAS